MPSTAMIHFKNVALALLICKPFFWNQPSNDFLPFIAWWIKRWLTIHCSIIILLIFWSTSYSGSLSIGSPPRQSCNVILAIWTKSIMPTQINHGIFCSWVSVHPKFLPPPRCPELMFCAVVGSELVFAWAFRQWSNAHYLYVASVRRKNNTLSDSECSNWTLGV